MAEPVSEVAAELGRRVRKRRKELGYSQEGFAEACGLDRSYMGHIERGEKNITLHTMVRLSLALKMDLSEIVEGLQDRDSDVS